MIPLPKHLTSGQLLLAISLSATASVARDALVTASFYSQGADRRKR